MSKISEKLSKCEILKVLELKKPQNFINFEKLVVGEIQILNSPDFEFFIDDFLPKCAIVGFYGAKGIGKSMFMLGLCQMLLKNFKNLKILYIDGDNGLRTHKRRGLNHLIAKFDGRFKFVTGENERGEIVCSPRKFIKEFGIFIENKGLNSDIIILDCLRNFYPKGANLNEDRYIDELFDDFKAWRRKGASVIFIHHPTKILFDENGVIVPKGSGAICDNCDYFIEIKRNELDDFATMLFSITDYGKARSSWKNRAFKMPKSEDEFCTLLANNQNILQECDYDEFCEFGDGDSVLLKDSLIEILKNSNSIKQCDLINALRYKTKLGNNAIFAFLKNSSSAFCEISNGAKNAKFYSLKVKFR